MCKTSMYSESSKQCQEQFKKNKISGCLWIGRVAQMVKRLPTMWETWVWPLGREDPLEKEMTTHSSTLVWKIPWTDEPGRLQSTGLQRVGHDWTTSLWIGRVNVVKMLFLPKLTNRFNIITIEIPEGLLQKWIFI